MSKMIDWPEHYNVYIDLLSRLVSHDIECDAYAHKIIRMNSEDKITDRNVHLPWPVATQLFWDAEDYLGEDSVPSLARPIDQKELVTRASFALDVFLALKMRSEHVRD